jgi:hypothetical protein
MKSQLSKHWSSKGYNSPFKQSEVPSILRGEQKPVEKKKPSYVSEKVTGTGPRNSEQEIKKGREKVEELKKKTVGPSGTYFDAPDDDYNKLDKEKRKQRAEENMRE